jgi:flagellar biogenesis protein FliO
MLELLPQLLAILGVFALLGFTLWWLKRRGAVQIAPLPFRLPGRTKGSHPKMLQRVDALQLSPTHSLNLVRMADRAILIGISPHGFCLVESSPWKTLEAQMEVKQ